MDIKKYLNDVITSKKAQMKSAEEKSRSSNDINEVRSIGDTLRALKDEIADAEEQLKALETEETPTTAESEENSNENSEDQRFQIIRSEKMTTNLNPVASFRTIKATEDETRADSIYGTIEYRYAFKDYVQKGVPIPEKYELRANERTSSSMIGAVVPKTVMDELIKEEKLYGQVYNKVRKLNIKGGVYFPIGTFKPTFNWVNDNATQPTSETKRPGSADQSVQFSYYLGEVVFAQTLLAQIVELDIFENEIVKLLLESFLKEMDTKIISGTGTGQPLGIINDKRVPTKNIIQMREDQIGQWTEWRKLLFSQVPLAKRGQGEFLFTPSTVEQYLLTMKDQVNHPIFKETTDLTMGNEGGSFFGRNVTLVEPGVLSDFGTAATGDVIGIYWVPNDYAINSNMEWTVKRYFKEDTNDWVYKGLVVIDGKLLDTSSVYIIKKGAKV